MNQNISQHSNHDSTLEELEKLLNDEEFCQLFPPVKDTACMYIHEYKNSSLIRLFETFLFLVEHVHESSTATSAATPDLLNMAFIDVTSFFCSSYSDLENCFYYAAGDRCP